MFFFVKCVFFIGLSALFEASTISDEKTLYEESSRQCSMIYPLSIDEQMQLIRWEMPRSRNVRCYLACTFKKVGMMDEEGRFTPDMVIKKTEIVLESNPALMKKTIAITNACRSVNDQDVEGDTEGCNRAALIFKCTAEQSDEWDKKWSNNNTAGN